MRYILTAVLMQISLFAGAQAVTRNAVLKKGQQFERSSIVVTNFESIISGRKQKNFSRSTQISNVGVEEVLDSAYVINYSVTRRMEQKGEEKFDTDNPKDTGYAIDGDALRADIGKVKRVIANRPYFTIMTVDTSVPQMPVFNLFGAVRVSVPAYAAEVYDMVASLRIGQTQVGEIWIDSLNNGARREMWTSTLSAVNETEAIIEVVSTRTIDTTVGDVAKVGIKSKVEGKAKIVFDPKTGIVKKIETNEESSGTSVVMGVEYPFTSKEQKTIQITLKND